MDELTAAARALVEAWRAWERRPEGRPHLEAALGALGRSALNRWRDVRGIRVGDRVAVVAGKLAGEALGEVLDLDHDRQQATIRCLGDTRPRTVGLYAVEMTAMDALVEAFDHLEAVGAPAPDRRHLEREARTRNRGRRTTHR